MSYLPLRPGAPAGDNLYHALREALNDTDVFARDNVTHDARGVSLLDAEGKPITGMKPRGGPFGAMLAISLPDGSLERVGALRANNVVGSGVASFHAEDQALLPDQIEKLEARLKALQAVGERPHVWMVSSGQSCPCCHIKQEITARHLMERGLIGKGDFNTLYGATFDDTAEIAGFFDAQYADAAIFAQENPGHKDNLIRLQRDTHSRVPEAVMELLLKAEKPVAVVVRGQEIYAVGEEARTAHDLFATPEVMAIRKACQRLRNEEDVFESWKVDGTLYTTTLSPGPLLFTEAAWTGIRDAVSVEMPLHLNRQQATQEAPNRFNHRLFMGLAGGYGHEESVINVFRDTHFLNLAQPAWAQVMAADNGILYNGSVVSPAVEALRDTHTRTRFAAPDLAAYFGDEGARTHIQPLKQLARLTL
jgi:tRNA(Arg) A34 adenosine deaminase TadA